MSELQLRMVAGVLCFAGAAFLAGLHVISNAKRDRWMDLPTYVRAGIMACMTMSFWRGIQFFSPAPVLSNGPAATIQAEGVLFLAAIVYLIGSVAFWVAARHLPDKAWKRVRYVEQQEKLDPNLVPVMMPVEDVAKSLTLTGTPAFPPRAGGSEAIAVLKAAAVDLSEDARQAGIDTLNRVSRMPRRESRDAEAIRKSAGRG